MPKLSARICDQSEVGNKILKDFMDSVHSVSGCTIEMLETTPQMILSPVMRNLILENAKKLDGLYYKVLHRLCIDWPDFMDKYEEKPQCQCQCSTSKKTE